MVKLKGVWLRQFAPRFCGPDPGDVPARPSPASLPRVSPPIWGFSMETEKDSEHDEPTPECEDIVRWQLTGILMKKSPVHGKFTRLVCEYCRGDWHGLPTDRCRGSFRESP